MNFFFSFYLIYGMTSSCLFTRATRMYQTITLDQKVKIGMSLGAASGLFFSCNEIKNNKLMKSVEESMFVTSLSVGLGATGGALFVLSWPLSGVMISASGIGALVHVLSSQKEK